MTKKELKNKILNDIIFNDSEEVVVIDIDLAEFLNHRSIAAVQKKINKNGEVIKNKDFIDHDFDYNYFVNNGDLSFKYTIANYYQKRVHLYIEDNSKIGFSLFSRDNLNKDDYKTLIVSDNLDINEENPGFVRIIICKSGNTPILLMSDENINTIDIINIPKNIKFNSYSSKIKETTISSKMYNQSTPRDSYERIFASSLISKETTKCNDKGEVISYKNHMNGISMKAAEIAENHTEYIYYYNDKEINRYISRSTDKETETGWKIGNRTVKTSLNGYPVKSTADYIETIYNSITGTKIINTYKNGVKENSVQEKYDPELYENTEVNLSENVISLQYNDNVIINHIIDMNATSIFVKDITICINDNTDYTGISFDTFNMYSRQVIDHGSLIQYNDNDIVISFDYDGNIIQFSSLIYTKDDFYLRDMYGVPYKYTV